MMKKILTLFLVLIGITLNAQTTDGWTALEDSLELPGLELNPLKGIAANFNTEGTWSGFPHSIANKTFVYGELVNDNGTFDFSAIDAFIEKEAQFGRFSMIQVNVDNGELINPHIDDFYGEFEDPNSRVLGDYKGHQFDLPPFLDNVKRIYYLGKPQVEGQTQVTDETTGIRKNVFPWDVPRTEIVNGEEIELGDPQGNPSLLVDYNDAELVAAMKALIEALAAAYDNDDRMAIVHYGMYGIFGEWDLGAAKVYVDDLVNDAGDNLGLDFTEWIMTFDNQAVVINAYQNNFTQTNLVGRVPDLPNPQSVGYSDGLYFGASLSDDEAFSYFFHPTLISNNVDENWRNKMIGGEMDPKLQGAIWDRNYWETTFPQINQSNSAIPFDYSVFGDKRFTRNADIPQNVEEVFQQTHPTFIFQNYMMQNFFVGNEGDNHLTPNPLTAEEIEKFPLFGQNNQVFWDNAILATKKLGYTFYVDEFNLSASNGFPAIEVNIQNLGIAPMYANWEVEFAVIDANGIIDTIGRTSSWNLQGIQPSVYKEGVLIEENIVNKRTFVSDDDVLDGEYTFLLRIVNPLGEAQQGIRAAYPNAKPVRFANKTQDENLAGWLTLGNATITNGELGEAPIVATSFTADGPTTGLSMNLLSELQLAVTSVPANVPYEWRSNLPQIASVDQNGNVTSSENTPGDVIITAITTDGQEVVFEVTVTSYRDITDDINSATRIQGEFYSSIFEDGDGDAVNDPRKTPITGVEDFGEIAVTNTNNLQGPDGQDLLDENGELVGPYWIEFDIDVKVAADYEIDFRASSPFGANVEILRKGETETEYQEILTAVLPTLPQEEFIFPDPIVDFYPDGSPLPDFAAIFNIYKTSTSNSFSLPVGKQTIRLQGTGYNLNWIEFKIDPCFGFTETIDENCDDGNPATLVDRYSNRCACEGTAVERFVDITNGGLIEAEEYSNALNVTEGPAPANETSAQIVENFGTGDWLEYAVEIQGTASKNFELDFRASSPFGGTVPIQLVNDAGYNLISTTTLPVLSEEERIFQLDENGNPLLDENGVKLLDFGETFKIYKTTTSDIITLPPGKYILRLLPDGYNLNWIEFRFDDIACIVGDSCSDGDPTTENDELNEFCECAGTPIQGITYTLIPAQIEAEDYTTLIGNGGIFLAEAGKPADVDLIGIELGEPIIGGISGAGSTEVVEDRTRLTYAVTVDPNSSSTFVLEFRASNPFGVGNINILDNGQFLTNIAFTPGTDFSYYTYLTYESEEFQLEAGNHIITLDVQSAAINLDWIEFKEIGIDYTLIPARIQAEDFTSLSGNGGEFLAEDSKPADVDLIGIALGEPIIGGTSGNEAGENRTILNYAVTVANTANFVLDFRASNPFGVGNINILRDDVLIKNIAFTPSTDGSFYTYLTFESEEFELEAGNYIITLDVQSAAINLDWIEFREIAVDYTLIPARIQAEDFTSLSGNGGEFLAEDSKPADVDLIGIALGEPIIGGTSGNEAGENRTILNYAVTVANTANFVLDFRAANPFGVGNINILKDDVLINNIAFTTSTDGSFYTYLTFESEEFELEAGNYIITLDVQSAAINLDWIEFREIAVDYTLIPARIQAEDFTSRSGNGGEFLAETSKPADVDLIGIALGEPIIGGIAGNEAGEDRTILNYAVTVETTADYVLDFRAANPFGVGNINILKDDVLINNIAFSPSTDGSFYTYLTYSTEAFELAPGDYIISLDVQSAAINLDWIEFRFDACPDADADGICDADDVCPEFDDNLIGTACDDADACTTGDVYTADCDCAGTFADADADGICDADDVCPEFDDNLLGTACDDGDACTTGDVYAADCGCAGTFADADADGICDADDVCPEFDDNLIGTTCDDGDACTTGDVYTADCGCAGTFADVDADGICDADDVCPEFDDNLIGTPCDDGDACTTGDVYAADCGCAGTFADADADGICDADDVCPEFDDNLIGTACDDGDACTINDVYTMDCTCAGTSVDQLILDESFSNSLGQFTLSSGAFSSAKPNYENFVQQANSVRLEVGGVDNSVETDMSLALTTSFTSFGNDVIINIDYELLADQGYDEDEWTAAILEVDGQRINYNGNDYLSKLIAGSPGSTGNQSVAVRLSGLADGNHSLVFGLLNNKKTYNTESSALIIDNINISQDCSGLTCEVGAPCNDGNANTTNDAYTIDCLCEGTIEVALDAIHDAYLQGTTNFNTDKLRVENNNRTSYLQFDLTGLNGTINSVDLVMTVDNDPGNGLITVSKGDHTNWTETDLSVANKPTPTSLLGELDGNYDQGLTYTWNLSAADIDFSEQSFIVEHLSGNDVAFKSSENSAVSQRPKLVVNYTPGTSCTAAGQSCDDGEDCTINDVYDSSCNCAGTYLGTVFTNESFNNTTGQFTVNSGAFSNPQPNYENFTQLASGVSLEVGGVDNSTQTDMSLGLSTSFVSNGSDIVVIDIDYELIVDQGYDQDEWTEAILEVDGQRVSYLGNDYLSKLVEGSPTTTGPQSVSLILYGLAAGNHTAVFGLLNNKKTYSTEKSELLIDRIRITEGCPQVSPKIQNSQATNNDEMLGKNDLKVFPNPTNDFFWVNYELAKTQAVTIRILDLNGRTMLVKENAEVGKFVAQQINTSSWIPGMYTVLLQTRDFVKTERILIVK